MNASRKQMSPLRGLQTSGRYDISDRQPQPSDSRYQDGSRYSEYQFQPSFAADRVSRPSTVVEEAEAQIDSRHEELKRQIAIKEQYLMEMESDREETQKRIRTRLQGQTVTQSGVSFDIESKGSRSRGRNQAVRESQRGAVSPHDQQMAGFRSTHYRPTLSSDRVNVNVTGHTSDSRRDPTLAAEYGGQLQFHPTRLTKKQLTTTMPEQPLFKSSPLRSRSREKSGERVGTAGTINYQNVDVRSPQQQQLTDSLERVEQRDLDRAGDTLDPIERSRSPFAREVTFQPSEIHRSIENRGSQSPLRNAKSPAMYNSRNQGLEPSTNAFTQAYKSSFGRSYGTQNPGRDIQTDTGNKRTPFPESSSRAAVNDSIQMNQFPGMTTDSQRFPRPQTTTSYRERSISPIERNAEMLVGPNARGQLYSSRVDEMTVDNESLQRRLGQVTNELERIRIEKDNLRRQLEIYERENEDRQAQLKSKDELDMQNQTMQEDLERIKNENHQTQQRVNEYSSEVRQIDDKVVTATSNRANLAYESNSLNQNITKRVNMLDSVSSQRNECVRDLQNTDSEIARVSQDELNIKRQNIDLDNHTQRLRQDRQDLLRNYQNLTVTFDECVRDITKERRNMDARNDWQTKLIVSKSLFMNLELFQKARQQVIFTEIASYTNFDKNCQVKLRNFGNRCNKVGKYKMKIALNQWYDRALKPFALKNQNQDVSIMIDCNKLMAKVFYAWVEYQRNVMDKYHSKTNGIEKMQFILNKTGGNEVKRALQIWKENKVFNAVKSKKFKELIQKRNARNMTTAFDNWRSYGKYIEYQVRLKITQTEFCNKFFLSQIFSQMRFIIRNEKRQRIRKLNHYLKGWKNYIHYNRHLMQTNMATIQRGKIAKQQILRKCFAQIRLHREEQKHVLIEASLRNEVDVAIENFSKFNKDKQSADLTKAQIKCGKMISEMFGKKFYSYFYYWKALQGNFNVNMRTKVSDQLIKCAKGKLKLAFTVWRNMCFEQIKAKKMKSLEEIKAQCELNQGEVLQVTNYNKAQDFIMVSAQSKLAEKMFRKLFYRKRAQAMGKWKDICNIKTHNEDKVLRLMIKAKKRNLKVSFDRFCKFSKRTVQVHRNVNGAEQMRQVLETRQRRKMFHAICQLVYRDKKAKGYWMRILNKMDKFIKLRTMKRWCENAHMKVERQQHDEQNQITEDLERMNEMICELEHNNVLQTQEEEELIKLQRKKAYRQLGNYFMRTYTTQTAQKFKWWKDLVREKNHKKAVILRTVAHWRKHQLEYMRQVLWKFNYDAKKSVADTGINRQIYEQEMVQIERENMEISRVNRRQQAEYTMAKHSNKSDMLEKRYFKLVQILDRRNQEWTFCSKKRSWFQMWKQTCRQEIAFVHCVDILTTKSIRKRSFDHMYQVFKEMKAADIQKRNLKRFVNKLQRLMKIDGFTRIKCGARSKVGHHNDNFIRKIEMANDEFHDYIDRTQNQNNARVFKFFMHQNKSNVWKALHNVTSHFKLVKAKTKEFQQRQKELKIIFALNRWKARKNKTKWCKAKQGQLIQHNQFKYYRAAFYRLKQLSNRSQYFFKTLANLEKTYRQRNMDNAFDSIKAFAGSKGKVVGNNKAQGGQQVSRYLATAYLNRLAEAFNKFQHKLTYYDEKSMKTRQAWGKASSRKMRDAFDWWVKKDQLLEVEIDMYETGPVRAEYWEQSREIENLKQFMREERFTEDEIDRTYDKVCKRTQNLLDKYMKRWKLRGDTKKRLMPVVWQRWRYYVGNVKLLRWQFQTCYNDQNEKLADLQFAFRKWRDGPQILQRDLHRLPVAKLSDLALRATKEVIDASEQLGENQSIQNHLMIQRDEFLNYYIKGQVLAMAYVRDKYHYTQRQALNRWVRACHNLCCNDFEKKQIVSDQKHDKLSQKEEDLNDSIAKLTKDNEEMHLFADDVKVIRKNKERLEKERDTLANKLKSSEKDYLSIVEENERLKRQVEDAEARAKNSPAKKFIKPLGMKGQKPEKAKPPSDPAEETEDMKKQRERFEKLSKMGGGIR